jgi:glycerophosphoryl diester phosphodiesterase
MVFDVICKHNLESRSIVQSFDFRTLHGFPGIRTAALWEGPARPFVEIAREASAGIIAPYFELVTPEQVEAAHAAKLEVIPWTANTPEAWRKLIDAGVDAIITDHPAALIAYLKQGTLPDH